MPTGQKTIVWTAANDERLLLSILAVHNIKVDGPSVAKVFGNNIAPSVIQTRMKKLKAKARALNPGVVPTDAVVTDAVVPSATKRGRETARVSSGPTKKRVKTEGSADEGNDIDNLIGNQATAANDHTVTPPATPRKKTSTTPTKSTKLTTPSPPAGKEIIGDQFQVKRCSPRDNAKPNYCQLDDPFVAMEGGMDEDGHNAFGQGTNSESEDSVDSDKDLDAEEVSTEA